ncbi:hypothetical protein D3C84_683790 [compost metagenome]
MGDHEHRQPGLAPQLQEQGVHVFADARIEGAEGFVEQQHPRPHDQRLGDGQSLLHAAGELRRVLVQRMAEADFVQQHRGLFAGLFFRAAEQASEQGRTRQFEAEGDVVQHAQVREHRVALEHHATAGVRFTGQGLAVEQDLAATGAFLAEQQAQEGRFAATGRTHQGAELTLVDVQVEAFKHHLIGVLLPDVFNGDEAHLAAPSYQGNARRVRRLRPQSISQASRVIHTT